jgi:photosystem II P680 reaction center D1 protein
MIPNLLTKTSVFIISFIPTPLLYIDGIHELVFGSLIYGNNIIYGVIIPTLVTISLHFYPIWEVTFIDEWLYNGGPYELIILHILFGISCYVGHEWELILHLGMSSLDCCFILSSCCSFYRRFLDLPYRSRKLL